MQRFTLRLRLCLRPLLLRARRGPVLLLPLRRLRLRLRRLIRPMVIGRLEVMVSFAVKESGDP